MRISFHPEATAELEASADWYAARSPAAARDFCVAVDIALANIETDPERFVHTARPQSGVTFGVVQRAVA